MGDSAYKNLPNSFADFLMAHIASKVAEKQEQSIWRGLAANAGEFNGLTVLSRLTLILMMWLAQLQQRQVLQLITLLTS